MKVQVKLLLLIVAIIGGVLFIFTANIRMEKKKSALLFQARSDEVKNVFDKIISLKGEPAQTLASDYGWWDDTVDFVRNPDMTWAKDNLDAALPTFKTNAIWIYRTDGSLVYSVNDLKSEGLKEIPFAKEALPALFKTKKYCKFFMWTPEGLVEVWGTTIVPTADHERQTPAQGYLLTGRIWNKEYIEEMGELTSCFLEIRPIKEETSFAELYNLREGRIVFSRDLRGWDGRSIAAAIVSSEFPMFRNFSQVTSNNVLFFIVFFAAGIFIILLSIVKMVGLPLYTISSSLSAQRIDPNNRLLRKRDEFGDIARLIKRFFVQQEDLRKEIADRKFAEEMLQKQSEELQTMIDASPAMIFYKDTQNRFIRVNKAFAEIVGIKREGVEDRLTTDIFPNQAEASRQDDKEVITTGRPKTNIIEPWETHKGIRWAQTDKIPYKDKGGNIVGVIGFAVDITERKVAEEALRQSEERFRTLVSNIPGVVYRCKPGNDRPMEFISEAIRELSGYPANEFIDNRVRSYYSIVVSSDRALVHTIIQEYIERRLPYALEYRIICADGSLKWVYEKGNGIFDRDGKLICSDGAIFDITERKKAEMRLTKINNCFLSFETDPAKNINRLVALCGELLEADGALYNRLDKGSLYPVGQWNIPSGYEPKNKPEGRICYDVITRGKEEIAVMRNLQGSRYLVSDPDVKKFRLQTYIGYPIKSRDKFIGALCVIYRKEFEPNEEDKKIFSIIASAVKVEEERDLALERLQEAYNKIKETQVQLIQTAKMAAVGQLASGVAHEINNPLTGVLNNVQLIKMLAERKKEFSLKDFKELLNDVEESSLRCKEITRSLLDFARVPTLKMKTISINETIEKVLRIIGHELELQNILIQKELQPDLPLVLGDPQLLQQVIYDMIINAKWAIEKMPHTGLGTIKITTAYPVADNEVLVSISDSGIGIPKENLERIFEPFFSTKPVGEGTGLGLSLAYNIIKEYSGRIEVESEEGKGTTFRILLPLQRKA